MSGSWLDSLGGILPGTTGQLDPSSTANPAGYAGVAVGTGTGQYGMVPMQSNIGSGTVSQVVQDFKTWLDTPFTTPLSPSGLIILVGVVLASIIGWNLIFYHIRIAGEAI